MSPERESFEVMMEDELPHQHHPELHTPYLEQVVEEVDAWKYRHSTLSSTPTEELQEWREDFQLVEEEQLSGVRITFDTIHQFIDRVEASVGADSGSKQSQEVIVRLKNIETRIRSSVQEYFDAVKYHTRQSKTMHLHENGAMRLKTASSRRGDVHNTLIDVLERFRQVATEELPKKELQGHFQPGELDQLISHAVFSKPELSKRGATREKIGEWALNLALAEQAKIIRQTIEAEEASRAQTTA